MKIAFVVGTRPNFVKIAPLLKACQKYSIRSYLIHTGQHFDHQMSDAFFEDLKIPKPDINLGIWSDIPKDLKKITSEKISQYLRSIVADIVVVVGDSDATCAGAMGAKKAGIKLAHVEAGLRSFDMAMPEEVNRLYIDNVSDYLFVSEPSGIKNLKDAKTSGRVFFVGNVMIDSVLENLPLIKARKPLYPKDSYGVVTLHRKSNVHESSDLRKSIDIINHISKNYSKLVFPMHPRTKHNLNYQNMKLDKNIKVIDPLSYLEFQSLLYNSKFALTDSGGIQDETTFYGKPCVTLRYNTERPITYRIGSSVVVGLEEKLVIKSIRKILSGKFKKGRVPRFWDGKSSGRIAKILLKEYESGNI